MTFSARNGCRWGGKRLPKIFDNKICSVFIKLVNARNFVMEWNRIKVNGMEWNISEWSGME